MNSGKVTQAIEAVECDNGKTRYTVGKKAADVGMLEVKEIGQHSPQGPGDVWFYDVIFTDDSAVRVYNPTRVFIGKPKPALDMPEKKFLTN